MSIAVTALPRAESWPPFCIFVNTPTEIARTRRVATITASRATTTTPMIKLDVTETQTVLNSDLLKPTKTAPNTNRPAKSAVAKY